MWIMKHPCVVLLPIKHRHMKERNEPLIGALKAGHYQTGRAIWGGAADHHQVLVNGEE